MNRAKSDKLKEFNELMNAGTEDLKWHGSEIYPYFLRISSRSVSPFLKRLFKKNESEWPLFKMCFICFIELLYWEKG